MAAALKLLFSGKKHSSAKKERLLDSMRLEIRLDCCQGTWHILLITSKAEATSEPERSSFHLRSLACCACSCSQDGSVPPGFLRVEKRWLEKSRWTLGKAYATSQGSRIQLEFQVEVLEGVEVLRFCSECSAGNQKGKNHRGDKGLTSTGSNEMVFQPDLRELAWKESSFSQRKSEKPHSTFVQNPIRDAKAASCRVCCFCCENFTELWEGKTRLLNLIYKLESIFSTTVYKCEG